jgi:hypothetical protein
VEGCGRRISEVLQTICLEELKKIAKIYVNVAGLLVEILNRDPRNTKKRASLSIPTFVKF